MASDSPARDFLLPRLSALVDEAVAHGFARDVAVAVLIDLVTSPHLILPRLIRRTTRHRIRSGSEGRTVWC